jgi:drug/metabolite transporter, DME family
VAWAMTVMGLRAVSRDPHRAVGAPLIAGNALACLGCLPLALPVHGATATDWIVIGGLGVFQIAFAYVLVSAALRALTALEGVLLLLLEPVLNPLWAALLEGERPGPWALAGGAIILATALGDALRGERQ